jgi:hypothetical protein
MEEAMTTTEDRTAQALVHLKRVKEAAARARAQDELEAVQAAVQAAATAPPQPGPEPRGKAARPPLDQRPSACMVCGKATEPGDGEQLYAQRQRRVKTEGGSRIETFWGATWKLCQRCDDIALSNIVYADWLGIDPAPGGWHALAELAREFPQAMRDTLSADGKVWRTEGELSPGPQRYDQEPDSRAGDDGYPRPWQHPGAKRGRPLALARWIELQALWSDDGRRHDTLECCGVCGRSHAFRPVVNPPAGWRDNGTVRWSELRILGGRLTCSACFKAYRQSSAGGGLHDWTLADWAAAQAAGVHPMAGMAARVGHVMPSRNAPALPLGEERAPWEHLGPDVLARLRGATVRLSRPRANDQPLLDLARSA